MSTYMYTYIYMYIYIFTYKDKAKVCKILEQKSRDERSLLGVLDAQYDEKFQHIIEVCR
jgi:hypothetical protein